MQPPELDKGLLVTTLYHWEAWQCWYLKPSQFPYQQKRWLSLVCSSGRRVRENLPSTRAAVTTPISVQHHRLDWQLHQLQLWGHGTLCSGGKTGACTWIEVQIQVHHHTRLRADPCHHWKGRLCEYGCSLHFQTERVKFFRTVLRGPT